jgi:methylmalonyl-CoA mutase
MNDEIQVYRPQNNVRVVTATSLFDGHDASINIFGVFCKAPAWK